MSRHGSWLCCCLAATHAILAAGCGRPPGPPLVESSRAAQGPEPTALPESGGQAVASRQEIVIRFAGRVEWIEPLGRRELAVTPVHPDPMFALAVRVDSVDQQKTPIQAGRATVFAIHSPTKLFAEDPKMVIGRSFAFRVVWHTGPPARFSRLAVVAAPASFPRAD